MQKYYFWKRGDGADVPLKLDPVRLFVPEVFSEALMSRINIRAHFFSRCCSELEQVISSPNTDNRNQSRGTRDVVAIVSRHIRSFVRYLSSFSSVFFVIIFQMLNCVSLNISL